MNESIAKRKQAQNEVYFRNQNQKVQIGFDVINDIALQQGDAPFSYDKTMPLFFYCECSDENCIKRLSIRLDRYNSIHEDKRAFVIAPNHQVVEIETVTKRTGKYWIVEKIIAPPPADHLNKTVVTNT